MSTQSNNKLWCPELPVQEGVFILKIPMGAGKTTQAAKLAKSYGEVVSIGPTRALTGALAHNLDLVSYEDISGDITEPRVAVCLPSLCRVSLDRKGFLLVLDEADQLFDLLHSKEIMRDQGDSGRNTHRVYAHLKFLMQNAAQVVINDAYASPRIIREIARMIGAQTSPTIVSFPTDYKPLKGFKEVKMKNRAHLIWKILEAAEQGNKGVVACDTKEDVKVIAALLANLGMNVAAINADSSESVKSSLKDATTNLSGYDWIVYNQAAGSGVSLEMEGYMSFIVARNHLGTNGAQLRQLSGRLRAPQANTRYSFITPGTKDLELDLDAILNTELKIEQTMGQIISHSRDDKGNVYTLVANPDVVASRADSIWYKNMTSVNAREWYYEALQAEGATLVSEEAPEGVLEAYKALIDEAEKAIDANELDNFKAAMEVTRERALSTTRTSTDDEKLSAKKHFHKEFFGEAGMENDEVILNSDKKREEVKLLVDVRLIAADKQDVLVKKDIAQATPDWKSNKIESCLLEGNVIRARMIRKVLQMVGYSDIMLRDLKSMDEVIFGSHTFTESNLDLLVDMDNLYSFKMMFGLTCPDQVSKVSGFVCKLLAKLGIETKVVKRVVNGETVNARRTLPTSTDSMRALSERRYNKLLDNPVEPITPVNTPVDAPQSPAEAKPVVEVQGFAEANRAPRAPYADTPILLVSTLPPSECPF